MDRSENFIKISNNRLSVEIAKPGRIYSGARFDWTGFITQVTLDGINTFCSKEHEAPEKGTGGMGLCNEFGIDTALGYQEAKMRECFSKIGVGLLRRPSGDPYKFWANYETAPYPVNVSVNESSAEFIVEPVACNGYAVLLRKCISVWKNCLRIDYRLDNVGSKPVETNEYCHNFLCINQHKLGKDYSLNFPYDIKLDKCSHILSVKKRSIKWKTIPQDYFYHVLEVYTKNMPYQWELVYRPTGVGVRDISNLNAARLALWGAAHVVSPEVFIDINVKPGETVMWSRKYEFFADYV